jgi:hypothetical protein
VTGGQRKYSSWRRPFRLQLRVTAAVGFEDAPASVGQCQWADEQAETRCDGFEWCCGARFCREHWLWVYGQSRLPERWGRS